MNITYEWLAKNGFVRLERQERQPFHSMQRAIGCESIGETFMVAPEDLCLTLAPNAEVPEWWFCWVSKASTQHRHPHLWIHARRLRYQGELRLIYEGLTGRKFASGNWLGRVRDLGEPIFEEWPKR